MQQPNRLIYTVNLTNAHRRYHYAYFSISPVLLFATMLVACSSQPDYRAANGNSYGYSEQKISDTYYRVTFKARGGDSDQARAYALRRAAEITDTQGYDWFVVVDKETLIARQQDDRSHLGAGYQQTTVQDCSLLTCRSQTLTRPQYNVGIHGGGREHVEAVLEIRLGKGVMPDSANVYPVNSQ